MKTDAYPHIHKKVTGEIFAVTEISKDGETWEDLPALQKKNPTMYQIAWVVMGHFTKCRIDIGNNITYERKPIEFTLQELSRCK